MRYVLAHKFQDESVIVASYPARARSSLACDSALSLRGAAGAT